MEKFNLNFNGGDNTLKSICWILSILSWLLLTITGWISLRWLDEDSAGGLIWTIFKYQKPDGDDHVPYMQLQMETALIYIIFILTMLIVLAGFIIYMVKSTCKRDDAVYHGMMGKWSKFHFFPLLCISAMFIAGECWDTLSGEEWADPKKNLDHVKGVRVSCFFFDLIGLISLIFIYIKTDLNGEWYIILTLKKGTYSCFITLLWYYFCYSIYGLRELHELDYNYHHSYKDFKTDDWKKGCGIAFSIIFGIGSLIFAFIFKDLVVAGMNTLIYLGLTAYYFQIHKDERKLKSANKNGDGAVDIIMMVFSIAMIAFLLITKKEECLKS